MAEEAKGQVKKCDRKKEIARVFSPSFPTEHFTILKPQKLLKYTKSAHQRILRLSDSEMSSREAVIQKSLTLLIFPLLPQVAREREREKLCVRLSVK